MRRTLSSYRPQHDANCSCINSEGYPSNWRDCSCGLTAALAREAQTDTLARFDEVLRSKFTPALNTGTAMDMLILVSETIREVRASSPSPGVLPEAQRPEAKTDTYLLQAVKAVCERCGVSEGVNTPCIGRIGQHSFPVADPVPQTVEQLRAVVLKRMFWPDQFPEEAATREDADAVDRLIEAVRLAALPEAQGWRPIDDPLHIHNPKFKCPACFPLPPTQEPT